MVAHGRGEAQKAVWIDKEEPDQLKCNETLGARRKTAVSHHLSRRQYLPPGITAHFVYSVVH